ncbi:PaaI family thioesterase [Pseudomonadota bacterium]
MKHRANPIRFMKWGKRFLSNKQLLQLYPPFWFMGVKFLEISPDWHQVRVLLPLRFRSRNGGGSMFGGCQAALADPIAALACAHIFPEYVVWTRKMCIDFLREGTTDLELRFDFPPELLTEIQNELVEKGRSTPTFEMSYHLSDGSLCSRIHNTVAIRPRGYNLEILKETFKK